MSQKTTIDKKRVDELKSKARKDADSSEPGSGGDINSVLYGPHTENQRATGGEYEH